MKESDRIELTNYRLKKASADFSREEVIELCTPAKDLITKINQILSTD